MKSFFVSILFFMLLVLLLTGAVYGVLRPEHSSVSAIGLFQVAAYDNGISLYQNFRGEFYTNSPFNDYVKDSTGKRTSLITTQELIDNSFYTSFAKPSPERIFESIGNYLGLITPSITYNAKTKTIQYDTSLNGNKLTVSKTLRFIKNPSVKKLGTTLSFSSGDLIYDKNGNLYTYAPEEMIILIKQTYGVTLRPALGDLTIPVSDKKIYIFNPNTSGVIMVQALKDQTLTIDRNVRFIEIEQDAHGTGNAYKTFMQISVFADPKTAQKSI